MLHNASSILASAKRVVVKVGSTLLIDEAGKFRERWLSCFVADIVSLITPADPDSTPPSVVIVSSGATGCGRIALGLGTAQLPLEEAQAAAAVGQVEVVRQYSESFARHNSVVAQVLITTDDTETRRRYINAHNTLTSLLRLGVIPIINENDAVTTRELRYGDNDRLAARIAAMISADVLIVLSNIDGLYRRDPNQVDDARRSSDHIPLVERITPEIESYAGAGHSEYSSGGMQTKLEAARMALAAGTHVVISRGTGYTPISDLLAGARHTCFVADASPVVARKRWIAAMPHSRGVVTVDAGADKALHNCSSLLPAGVVGVDGEFDRGDLVIIVDSQKRRIAIGLTAYSSDEARKIIGKRSGEVSRILGHPARSAMVHRDNLVLMEPR